MSKQKTNQLRADSLISTRWWFQICFFFIPIWGRFPFWLVFFKCVETTNQSIFCTSVRNVRSIHTSGLCTKLKQTNLGWFSFQNYHQVLRYPKVRQLERHLVYVCLCLSRCQCCLPRWHDAFVSFLCFPSLWLVSELLWSRDHSSQ